MPSTGRVLTVYQRLNDWLSTSEQLRLKPLDVMRRFERDVQAARQAMFLRYDIPGVRYWQPPGASTPFATSPGEQHLRDDVVELTRYEFVSRFGDPENL